MGSRKLYVRFKPETGPFLLSSSVDKLRASQTLFKLMLSWIFVMCPKVLLLWFLNSKGM